MLYLLLTRPELWQTWHERPWARDALLDELLRYIPHRSSVGLARIALEDVDLHGHRIRAGDPVYVSYLAANRDPDVFPEPDGVVGVGEGFEVQVPSAVHRCAGAGEFLPARRVPGVTPQALSRPGLRLPQLAPQPGEPGAYGGVPAGQRAALGDQGARLSGVPAARLLLRP
jgi:biflaviolin synthase